MKKTKLTRSLLAACSIVALSAVMYGCVHNGGDDAPATDMSGTPEPMPEPMPEPAGPTDLEETQTAAGGAAAAAMTASGNAATSASRAGDATMTLATLQTGDDSNSDAMGGRESARASSEAADDAADAASEAADASEAAAAATTGDEAEAAWRVAVNAQVAAEDAAEEAAKMAEQAIEAAKMELHIDGTTKWVDIVHDDGNVTGMSSVDATTGMLTTGTVRVDRKITGLLIGSEPDHTKESSEGQHFIQNNGPADETKYKQAISDGTVEIGKKLDTSDDKARLLLITHYEGEKKVRVFVDRALDAVMDPGGTPVLENSVNEGTLVAGAEATSLGMYYEADDRIIADDALPIVPDVVVTTAAPTATAVFSLDAFDRVKINDDMGGPAKGVEVFEITGVNDASGEPVVAHARLERTSTDDAGTETEFYQLVDIIADESMTDGGDADMEGDDLRPTTTIPSATEYDHIHFGVWAMLDDHDQKTNTQDLADLGIGFVQNIDGSGMTERQGVGTATYNGDWVAAVRRQYASDAEKGAIKLRDGTATLTADFEENEFKAELDNLATLEGTLSGNGFSGMTATDITHADLDADGDFEGTFSGGIYGPTGSEAAGVFDFDGDEAGAFVGAFGGTQ